MPEIIKPQKLTWNANEVAEILGVSVSKVYEMMRIEGFPTIKLGKRLLVSRKGLERWIEEQAMKGWHI